MFDIYLKIKCNVKDYILQVLDWIASDWRVKHSCSCCQNEVMEFNISFAFLNKNSHKLSSETMLEVSVIGMLDGNQLLQYVHHHKGVNPDPHQFTSDYYISEGLVDQFKHDVKPRPLYLLKKLVCSTIFI